MTHTTAIKFDTSRVDQFLAEQQKRLTEIQEFVSSKETKLKVYEKDLERFLEAVNCTDLVIGNMYSTGGAISKDYTADDKMIAHCTMQANKEYKNPQLAAKRLQEKWDFMIDGISANFVHYKIKPAQLPEDKGSIISFSIWF